MADAQKQIEKAKATFERFHDPEKFKQEEKKKNDDSYKKPEQYEKPTMEFDVLKLFFGEDYNVTDKICIKQPTIGDIIKFGEDLVYSAVNVFVANTTTYRLALWEIGIDWNKISDFEMFCLLIPNLENEYTKLIFGDLDFTKFRLVQLSEETQPFLYNEEQDVEITEEIYLHIREYLRRMFNIYPKVEKAKGKTTKQWIIEEEKMNRLQKQKDKSDDSSLFPLISACLNHPGFKYKLQELKQVGIIEFMDSVQRIQVYENTTALLRGSYSGFMDTSKIAKENFNFMREIKH